MRLERKNKVVILKYRVVFEELSQAEQELNAGSNSLTSHLNFFRDSLSDKSPGQVASFNKTFFVKEDKKINTKVDTDTSDEADLTTQEASHGPTAKLSSHPRWAKKLYKQIATSTHPDKTDQIKIDSFKKKLSEAYMLAVDSYNSGEYCNLLMIAADLDIQFDQELIKAHVQPAIKEYRSKLIAVTALPGYVWYHIPEKNKKESLRDHLQKMGFIFTDGEIEEAIRTVREKNKRKRGTRPVKTGRMKLR